MERRKRLYLGYWILLPVLLQISSACDQTQYDLAIVEMATNSLVYLHIECGVSAVRKTTGCIIQPKRQWKNRISDKIGYRIFALNSIRNKGGVICKGQIT